MCLLVDVKCSKGQPPLLRYSYSDKMIAFLFGLLIIVLIGIYLRSCLSISIIAWSRVDIVCHISLKSHIQSNCILIMMTIELFLIPFFFFLFYVCSLYGIIHIPVCRIQYIPCHEDTVSNSLPFPPPLSLFHSVLVEYFPYAVMPILMAYARWQIFRRLGPNWKSLVNNTYDIRSSTKINYRYGEKIETQRHYEIDAYRMNDKYRRG